ncbi:hypothetical protein M3B90_05030 [Dermabacter sp. p3-SID358]|uniref:hypothetical protein n=1 Tax=Dermabacter sp. p3-SID358 TaxID=2916114 RepID=UPI0021A3A26B|nr:hypothetical protein [Dermabacter sp. p3-SID358]MCT1866884.1 hypothetical protein [Dermabacter sp. p3-SID358]
MSETQDWNAQGYGAEAFAAFPPNLDTEAQGAAFLARLGLFGALAGVLAGLATSQITWWLSLGLFIAWVIGVIAAGCIAGLAAKKHRSGVGYPADGEAWLRTFARAFMIVGIVLGVATVGITIALTFALQPDANAAAAEAKPLANFTPAILLSIVSILAVAAMRWVASTRTTWLLYGAR